MIMRFNGFEIVIKKRIWFHFDDEVMDMWWKSRREGRDETRDKKTGSESVKGTLYPFSLFALFRIKVDLKSSVASSHLKREQKVVGTCDAVASPFFHQHSRLLRCAKKETSHLWLDESLESYCEKGFLIAQAIRNDHASDSIQWRAIFIPDF